MRKLLNTLYVSTPDTYLSLEAENIVLTAPDRPIAKIPLCNIENVVCFSYFGCSPALIEACTSRGIYINFMTAAGKFLGRFVGKTHGNVLVRMKQYQLSLSDEESLEIAKRMIIAKLLNSRQVLGRTLRDHSDRINSQLLIDTMESLKENVQTVQSLSSKEELRGIEGRCARRYFEAFDEMILKNKEFFELNGRTKRPPLDRTNAMLSFLYTILNLDIVSALESVGLDPYIGFLHTERSGRTSLALDMMEEFRCYIVDRLVVTMINLQQVVPNDFLIKETGAVLMSDDCRKKILQNWQERKKEIVMHPVLEEKVEIGLLPYVQAQLLSRYIRSDTKEYIPFLSR